MIGGEYFIKLKPVEDSLLYSLSSACPSYAYFSSGRDAIFSILSDLPSHRIWLPDFICKAIMSRQEIPHEELGAVRSLVAILQLAVHLYCRITRTEHPFWQKIRKDVLMELGIHLDTEQEYYEEITEQFLAGA